MAKPPESTKTSLRQKLAARAAERWPQLAGVSVRWHGQFAYVSGQLPDGTELPLFRLRYADSASTWGLGQHLGICHLPRQPRQLREISPAQRLAGRHPQEALDCACGLYLNDPPPGSTRHPRRINRHTH
jgi:hypothetical protein